MRKLQVLLILGLTLLPVSHARSQTVENDEAVFREIEGLRRLKAENPAAFQERIRKKRAFVAEQLRRMRASGSFERFAERRRDWRARRLAFMRARRPEDFRNFMRTRREHFQKLRGEPSGFEGRRGPEAGPPSRRMRGKERFPPPGPRRRGRRWGAH